MELAILIGLQGSGKTTFATNRLGKTHLRVSKDLLRNNKRPARRQRQLIEAALQVAKSVVVDNTNATVEDRAELIQLGRSYGARIVGYYFPAGLEDCLRRNRQRTGKEQVPDLALYATVKRFEDPRSSEGFDELFSVRLVEGAGFEVLPWMDEPRPGSSHQASAH